MRARRPRAVAVAFSWLVGGCLEWSRPAAHHADGGAPGEGGAEVADADAPAQPDGSGTIGRDAGRPTVEAGVQPAADGALPGADADVPEPDATVDTRDAGWPGDPSAPVLVLHMDESTWNGVAGEVRDDSGAENHGQAIDGATTTRSGRFGRAAELTSSYVLVPDSPSLRAGAALTVSVWFYADNLAASAFPGLVAKRNGFADQETFTIFLDPDHRVNIDVAGSDNRFVSQAVMTPSTWHHVVLVYDGALAAEERVRLYIDGALDTVAREASAEIPPFTSPLYVGNLPVGGDRFTGRIDELAVWRRPLDATEVAGLYQAAPSP